MTTAARSVEVTGANAPPAPPNGTPASPPSRALVLTAFATVYVVWGSTYLAIRYAVATLPPFVMAGARFVLAGAIMIAWAKWKDGARATTSNWRAAAVAGTLLLAFGNGAVVWAEQRVPSGLTALLVAAVPLWMVLADWIRPGGTRPTLGVVLGVAVGIGGIVLLVGPSSVGGQRVDPAGSAALVFGSLSWAIGSLYSRTADLPKNPIFATGMEMFAGGAVLWVGALLTGDWTRLDLTHASAPSITGFIYLVIFGSLIGFTAYAGVLTRSSQA